MPNVSLKKKVNIGIDARVLQKPLTGVGKYVSEVCKKLEHLMPNANFFLISNKDIDWEPPGSRWVLCIDRRWENISSLVWLKFFSSKFINELKLDAFWGTAHFLPPIKTPCLLTVHDLVHIYAPATMSSKLLWGHRLFMKKDVKKAKRIIAVSNGTKIKLNKYIGKDLPVVVAHPAVSNKFKRYSSKEQENICEKYGLNKPFFLMVATAEPRKNIINTIDAFKKLKSFKKIDENINLVLVGGDGWKNKSIKNAISSSDATIAVGYVPDEDLPILYSAATCFLFFSMYEGFGMPVREALCCGVHVMASDTVETREAGLDKAFYFGTGVADIQEALIWFCHKKNELNSIENFCFKDSWENTAINYAYNLSKVAD